MYSGRVNMSHLLGLHDLGHESRADTCQLACTCWCILTTLPNLPMHLLWFASFAVTLVRSSGKHPLCWRVRESASSSDSCLWLSVVLFTNAPQHHHHFVCSSLGNKSCIFTFNGKGAFYPLPTAETFHIVSLDLGQCKAMRGKGRKVLKIRNFNLSLTLFLLDGYPFKFFLDLSQFSKLRFVSFMATSEYAPALTTLAISLLTRCCFTEVEDCSQYSVHYFSLIFNSVLFYRGRRLQPILRALFFSDNAGNWDSVSPERFFWLCLPWTTWWGFLFAPCTLWLLES